MQECIVEGFDKHLAEMITGRSDVERMISIAEQLSNFMIFKEAVGGKRIYEIRLPMRRFIMSALNLRSRLVRNLGILFEKVKISRFKV